MLGEIPRSIGSQVTPEELFRKGKIGSETYNELKGVVEPSIKPIKSVVDISESITPAEWVERMGRMPKPTELGALVGGMRPDGVQFTYDDFFAMTTLDPLSLTRSPEQVRDEFLNRFGFTMRYLAPQASDIRRFFRSSDLRLVSSIREAATSQN